MRLSFRAIVAVATLVMVPAVSPAIGKSDGFSVVEEKGVGWFVRPDGKKFLSKGVDCVGPSVSAEKYDPAKPEYSSEYHRGETFEAWRERTMERLKSWKFNTIGGWSDHRLAGFSEDFVVTPVLHVGVWSQAP